jgi:hypothetical protein
VTRPRLVPDNTKLYDRQPGESLAAWRAFTVYRSMGEDRSLEKVGKELGKTRAIMERHSTQWNWVARAAAWDKKMDDARQREALKSIERTVREHQALLSSARGKLVEAIRAIKPEKMSAMEVARWLEVVVRAERESLGLPSLKVAVEHGVDEQSAGRVGERMAQVLASDPALALAAQSLSVAYLKAQGRLDGSVASVGGDGDVVDAEVVEDVKGLPA